MKRREQDSNLQPQKGQLFSRQLPHHPDSLRESCVHKGYADINLTYSDKRVKGHCIKNKEAVKTVSNILVIFCTVC